MSFVPQQRTLLTKSQMDYPETIEHIFPNGMKATIFPEQLCTCKKYLKNEGGKVCMTCEKRELPDFKKEKKESKK